jgi:hypothetical protein
MDRAQAQEDAATLLAKNVYGPQRTAQWWPGFAECYVMIATRPAWREISAPGTAIKGDRARWRPAGIELQEEGAF